MLDLNGGDTLKLKLQNKGSIRIDLKVCRGDEEGAQSLIYPLLIIRQLQYPIWGNLNLISHRKYKIVN